MSTADEFLFSNIDGAFLLHTIRNDLLYILAANRFLLLYNCLYEAYRDSLYMIPAVSQSQIKLLHIFTVLSGLSAAGHVSIRSSASGRPLTCQ